MTLHTHPALGGTALEWDRINFAVPSVGEIDDNVWFRVYLNVVDGGGLSQTTYSRCLSKETRLYCSDQSIQGWR